MIVEMTKSYNFAIEDNVLSAKLMQLSVVVWLVPSTVFDTVDPNVRLAGLKPGKASVKRSVEGPGADLYLGPLEGMNLVK